MAQPGVSAFLTFVHPHLAAHSLATFFALSIPLPMVLLRAASHYFFLTLDLIVMSLPPPPSLYFPS